MSAYYCITVYMYGHTYSKSMDQPGTGCQSCTWSAEQRKLIFPCPRSRLRIWSSETSSAVPSRVSLLVSILRLNLVLTYGIPPEFRGGVHLFILNRHTISGQSRVYRITQLRIDDVPAEILLYDCMYVCMYVWSSHAAEYGSTG